MLHVPGCTSNSKTSSHVLSQVSIWGIGRCFPLAGSGLQSLGKTIENYLDLDFKILFVHVVLRILFLPDTEFTWYDSAVKCLVHTRVELLIVQTPLLSTLRMFLARLRRRAASDGNLWNLAVGCTTGNSTAVWHIYNQSRNKYVQF